MSILDFADLEQIPELESNPLNKWANKVIQIGREKKYTDSEIKSWVKEWAKSRNYDLESINNVLRSNGIRVYNRRPVIFERYPKLVVCPKCVTIGKIHVYYPNHKLGYVIVHEKINGRWGITKKVCKYRRCYIFDKEQQKYIRQKLEFYENRDLAELCIWEWENPKPEPKPIPYEILEELKSNYY